MNSFSEIIQGLQTPELIIMLGIGLAVLLFGYRLKKAAFFIIWFLLGYIGATYAMPELTKIFPDISDNTLYQTLIPIAAGLVVALLGFSVEKICISGVCFVLIELIAIQYFGAEIQVIAIAGILGIVAGGAAILLMKPAIIVATAAAGAYAITLTTIALIANLDQSTFYWPMIIGFTAIGSVFQLLTTKRIL